MSVRLAGCGGGGDGRLDRGKRLLILYLFLAEGDHRLESHVQTVLVLVRWKNATGDALGNASQRILTNRNAPFFRDDEGTRANRSHGVEAPILVCRSTRVLSARTPRSAAPHSDEQQSQTPSSASDANVAMLWMEQSGLGVVF
ncbi:hypothetical protein PCANC_01179 [Puccinia coronata f. sp. avenae]|uniref:Uncharacterized protein n=1 Tax=Puccinia coronata f. sp. avenae TaxID=200324 RepID=A0A2N5W5S3_9BASI|nr:hypothetical protein PCANC_01179 [Puccinia coronata f. sp. avenae]